MIVRRNREMSDDSKLRAYLFTVEIDGIETERFQKCEGLEAETYVYEVEEGGLNHTTRKFRGRTRFPNLILEKGITENDSLFNWFKETCLENKKLERKNGSVVLKDTEGNEVKRWNFFRAFPCRWIGPKLVTNLGSDFAVERIEIAHEGIEVDNDSEPQENDNWFHIGKNMSEETNFIGTEESSADELEDNNIPQLNGSADQFATNMEDLVGIPYVWGGNTPENGGMDCSGSIIYGLNKMGNDIPDQSASDLYNNYTEPATGNVQRGDLRFLRDSDGNITHVQTITDVNGTRVNASGGPENSIENPGIIELLDPPLPTSGEIRRLHF